MFSLWRGQFCEPNQPIFADSRTVYWQCWAWRIPQSSASVKIKPLIIFCNSSNTVFGFSVFDAVNRNTVFDLQTPTSSHFDEGSFAVFVSRCAVKCSGCLMGQYTHRQFKLQLLNTPQPAWWSKLAQWLQYRWDLARAFVDQYCSNRSFKRTWCRQIWLRRSFRKILTHCF